MSSEAAHEFAIELDEIEPEPKDWAFPIRREWLVRVLADSELSVVAQGEEVGRFEVRLCRVGGDVLAETHVSAEVAAECARCLEQAPIAVDVRARTLLTREAIPDDLTEDELGPDSPLRESLDGDRVIFDDAVREQILLEAPMKPLCRPDCPGIEIPEHVRGPRLLHPDGSGREVDPRLSSLMNLQRKLAESEE